MNVIVTGGTGFIGRQVCQALIEKHHAVTVISRQPTPSQRHTVTHTKTVNWDMLEQAVNGADAIINLAGAPIADARWTPSRKDILLKSRIETTRRLVTAIGHASSKPSLLINASGIGFYGSDDTAIMTEASPKGEGFLANLSEEWELEANRAAQHGVRVICLRMGMVLGTEGGALRKMTTPFKFYVGGPIAPGTQKISWIDIRDLTRLFIWLLKEEKVSGPINVVAPESVSMNEFCKTLGTALHRPSWIPVPAFVLQLLLGELSEMLTTGQRVIPQKLTHEGFDFMYPTLDQSFASLLGDSMPAPAAK
ncbi:TIGR01777 family oxidoreductase [Nitrospira sp. M1]